MGIFVRSTYFKEIFKSFYRYYLDVILVKHVERIKFFSEYKIVNLIRDANTNIENDKLSDIIDKNSLGKVFYASILNDTRGPSYKKILNLNLRS